MKTLDDQSQGQVHLLLWEQATKCHAAGKIKEVLDGGQLQI